MLVLLSYQRPLVAILASIITICTFPFTTYAQEGELSNQFQPEIFYGYWQDSPSVGSGYTELYRFEEDGIFTWQTNLHKGATRLRMTTGEWYVKDNTLYLSATALLVREGSIELPGWGSMSNDRIGGELIRIDLSPNERVVEEYSILEYDDYTPEIPTSFTLRMDGEEIQLWKLHVSSYTEDDFIAMRDNTMDLEKENKYIKEEEKQWLESEGLDTLPIDNPNTGI